MAKTRITALLIALRKTVVALMAMIGRNRKSKSHYWELHDKRKDDLSIKLIHIEAAFWTRVGQLSVHTYTRDMCRTHILRKRVTYRDNLIDCCGQVFNMQTRH